MNLDEFTAGQLDTVRELVFAVGFFTQLERVGCDAVQLFGDAIIGEGETYFFFRICSGEGIHQWNEIGVSGEHDGGVKRICSGASKAGTGDGDIGFFFFVYADKGLVFLGPGLPFLKAAFVNNDFRGGEGPDI